MLSHPVAAGDRRGHLIVRLAISACLLVPAVTARAAEAPTADELNEMRRAIDSQQKQIDQQLQLLETQRREIEAQRRKLEALQHQVGQGGAAAEVPAATAAEAGFAAGRLSGLAMPAVVASPDGPPVSREASRGSGAATGVLRPSAQTAQAPGAAPATPPPATTPPQAPVPQATPAEPSSATPIEAGGVLTRRGVLVIEPQLQYVYDTSNQFFFDGVSVANAVLFGLIEANNVTNKTLTGAIAARYGITSRLETDVRVPYVYRDTQQTLQPISSSPSGQAAPSDTTTTDNRGIGDVEFGARYQINRGLGNWPFFVAGVRVKSDTGEGPYDVDQFDSVPTGSGFWAIEPGLGIIYPSEPAVLFANVGWLHNFSRDVNETLTDRLTGQSVRVGNVDPGDTWRFSFGLGVALNEKLSFNLGYSHDWVGESSQRFTPQNGQTETANVSSFQVGTLLFGTSYAVSDRVGFNFNVGVGVTEEAPDAQITVRVPVSFDLLK